MTITIFQKNWAFTSAESEKPQIKTGAFGPCYVVTFTSTGFAAMAHIDDTTQVESIKAIFDEFLKNSIAVKDIKVVILGGWKSHPESFKWGNKIITQIKDDGFENISTKNMFKKDQVTIAHQNISISKSLSHHLGALVDAKEGKTYLLKVFDSEIEQEQFKQMKLFANKYGRDLMDVEIPISQII
ncbi:MAG: hypothetical protein WBD50_01920 [Candidatus Rhabdochlamydia sp.]